MFDALNRNTSRAITLVSTFFGTTSETRTYDALNRITVNQDNDYKLKFEYAEIGLQSYVYKETQSYVGQTAYPRVVTKSYDAIGNKIGEGYPSGLNLTYGYDVIDQLSSVTDGTNTIASYTHIGLRKKNTTYQNQSKRANLYTGFRNELQSVQHTTSVAASIVRLDYGYNKVHDRLYERFGASGSTGDGFAYDKIRRLTTAWMGSVTPSSPSTAQYVKKIDYNYDDDGNRTSVVVTPWQVAPATTNYTTNNLYEYTAVGGTTNVWDANGNLTDNGTLKFEYNYKNLIVRVRQKSDNSIVADYKYDAAGRRVEKEVDETVERYIRSTSPEESYKNGNNPGGGGRYDMSCVVCVYDGSDAWQQDFVWNNEADGVQMLQQVTRFGAIVPLTAVRMILGFSVAVTMRWPTITEAKIGLPTAEGQPRTRSNR